MSSKRRIPWSDPNFTLYPELNSSCSPSSNPPDFGTNTHKSSVQFPLLTGTANYQETSNISKIANNLKTVHSVAISNPLSPNFFREIPVGLLSNDISLGPSNGDSIPTSTLPLNEMQEISNFTLSHDRSANSNLISSKAPREVLPIPDSNDLPCYPDNIDPFQPPNLLPESANYGELDPYVLLAGLQSPLSSSLERLWAQELSLLLKDVVLGNIGKLPAYIKKGTDLRHYFIFKRQLFFAPEFISALVLLSGEDAASFGSFEETVATLLLHPLAGPFEQSLADELIFLYSIWTYDVTPEHEDHLHLRLDEALDYMLNNHFATAIPEECLSLDSNYDSNDMAAPKASFSLSSDAAIFSPQQQQSPQVLHGCQSSSALKSFSLSKFSQDSLSSPTSAVLVNSHVASPPPPPPQSLSDCYDTNSQNIPSTLDPFELMLNEVVDYMLSTDYVTAIDGDLEEDDNDDAGLSKVPISTISPVKVAFLLSPNAASFIPQQQQLPQYTQDHQSASADKSSSPLMSSISSIESTSSPTSVTQPLSPVAISSSLQQQSPPDSPYSPEEEMPVYYEEDDDDSVDDSFLFDDYFFSLDLEPGTDDSPSLLSTLPFSPEESSSCTKGMNSVPEVPLSPVVVASPSPPPQSTHVVDRGGGGVISTPVCTPPLVGICSPPPPAAFVAAWWEGWKSSHLISDDYTPVDDFSSPPPPVTVEVAWWEGWKSLTLSIYIFLFSFSLAAISSPPPPVAPEVAWWEGWKPFSNTSSSPFILSTVTSHPKSRARRLAVTTSPLLLLSLLLNVIFFLNVCTLYVFPPDVSSNVLRSEPVSLASGSSEVGRVPPLSIPVAPARTLAETPWFPQFTLPVIPLAYCPLSSLCSRKGPRQVLYLLYFSFLLSSILLLPVPRVGRMVPFEEPILIYKPG